MLKCDIDEISFVFLPEFNGKFEEYDAFCVDIVEKLYELLHFEIGTTNHEKLEKGFSGYTSVLSFDDWQILLAWCETSPNMGVFCKFTGQGLKNYLSKIKAVYPGFEVYDLAKAFDSITDYFAGVARASKIDLAIDFINEGLEVNEIIQKLENGSRIYNHLERTNTSKIGYVASDGNVETIYVGSRKNKGIQALLRIYDKKIEQMETKGIFYQEAKNSSDWVRFEASYRQKYANQIGNDLLLCDSPSDLSGLIFRRFTDRYRFGYAKNEYWNTTKVMLAMADLDFDVLLSTDKRKNDLIRTFDYLTNSSGLESFLYKISQIYGAGSIDEFFEAVKKDYYETYTPNDDVINFLNKNLEELKTQKKPWE